MSFLKPSLICNDNGEMMSGYRCSQGSFRSTREAVWPWKYYINTELCLTFKQIRTQTITVDIIMATLI